MRAAVLIGARHLEVRELPEPDLGPGEVLIRVAASGICGTDLTAYRLGLSSGQVHGHEFCGIVEAAAPDADVWCRGDPVIAQPVSPCGTCKDCRENAEYRCAMSVNGVIRAVRPGGFAEVAALPAHRLCAVPARLSLEDACLTEPLAVALHALRRAGVRTREPATVIGLGPIGLLCVAALRATGTGSIFACDPIECRRELARQLGADCVAPRADAAPAELRRAPLVLECSGHPDALGTATDLADAGGRVVLIGIPVGSAPVDRAAWITRELRLIGSIAFDDVDFRDASQLLAERPAISRIITRRAPLTDAPEVFEQLVSRTAAHGKVVLDPRR